MIPPECKRLIEVDFPIAAVSAHGAREKSIRHGHPSTLHLWWARRPLAACRAVLLGLLLPDPCDDHCPSEFKYAARRLLEPLGIPCRGDEGLQKGLHRFVGDFANWDLSNNISYVEASKGLVKAAYPEETPLVVDPFAGGGSIPLEALRLGCDTFASDLNPVAWLILKVLLEDAPLCGAGLAEELRSIGMRIKEEAERELAELYPPDPDGAQPIAWVWARTVRCEATGCGAEIPLVGRLWLADRETRPQALRPKVVRSAAGPPQVQFEVFEPTDRTEVPEGTVSRAKARCLCCGAPLLTERVRAQLAAQRGGADVTFNGAGQRTGGARMLAVVREKEGEGRSYRLATQRDYDAVREAQEALVKRLGDSATHGLLAVPDEPLPPRGTLGFRVQRYGMLKWEDLFTSRQKLVLATLAEKARSLPETTERDKVLKRLAALAVSRFADDFSSLCRWMPRESPAPTFSRHALPMLFDYCEVWPFDDASWSLSGSFAWVAEGATGSPVQASGQVQLADAAESPLPDASCTIWFTDPPYYNAIPYSDLSDFFFVWLKRALPRQLLPGDPFDSTNLLTPKVREIVQDETKRFNSHPKDARFFEARMTTAFNEGRRVLREDGIGCVVFAHKTTEGWEALLSSVLGAGWKVTASWPILTERPGRIREQGSAALATSVHLVCRPRVEAAVVGDWSEVKRQMEHRVRDWMKRLLERGIRGADAIFSCVGPALEVYSRYRQVETPAGHVVPLGGDPEATEPQERGFLSYVFEAVSREALRQVLGSAETEGFEEDARLSALFLWTVQSSRANGNGHNRTRPGREEAQDEPNDESEEEGKRRRARPGSYLPFDTFIRITRPMGIHYQEWEGRIISIDKGIVRLLPVAERSEQLLGQSTSVSSLGASITDLQMALPGLMTQPTPPPVPLQGAVVSGRRVSQLTTLDRLHRAMLLFGGGHTALLRRVLDEERQQGLRFERLALALTALYTTGSRERRWIEGVQAMMRTGHR